MTTLRRGLTVIALGLLAACAGTPAEQHYYLLRSDTPAVTRALEPASYRLGGVSVAQYIDRAGLLLETAPGQIRPARNHLWAEPVQEGIRALLAAEISHALGRDIPPLAPTDANPTIRVRIDQLHGTLAGEAKLVAVWSVAQGDTILVAEQFAESMPLPRDGYAALAGAQKALLTQLARRIAANLK